MTWLLCLWSTTDRNPEGFRWLPGTSVPWLGVPNRIWVYPQPVKTDWKVRPTALRWLPNSCRDHATSPGCPGMSLMDRLRHDNTRYRVAASGCAGQTAYSLTSVSWAPEAKADSNTAGARTRTETRQDYRLTNNLDLDDNTRARRLRMQPTARWRAGQTLELRNGYPL